MESFFIKLSKKYVKTKFDSGYFIRIKNIFQPFFEGKRYFNLDILNILFRVRKKLYDLNNF